MLFVGVAVDYARAVQAATRIQSALDAGTIGGAVSDPRVRDQNAAATVLASLAGSDLVSTLTTSFSATSTTYQGTARATMQTTFFGIFGVPSFPIKRQAEARLGTAE